MANNIAVYFITAGYGALARTGWARIKKGEIIGSSLPFSVHESAAKMLAKGDKCCLEIEGIIIREVDQVGFDISIRTEEDI